MLVVFWYGKLVTHVFVVAIRRVPTREMSKFDQDVVSSSPPLFAKHDNGMKIHYQLLSLYYTVTDCEVHQVLQTVKAKFSDVLIPTDDIAKQNFLGKGITIYIRLATYQMYFVIMWQELLELFIKGI